MKPQTSLSTRSTLLILAVNLFWLMAMAHADDWSQWRGSARDGVWHEKGTLESFPAGGLKTRWRVPIGGGVSSPVVAQGRVYVTDSLEEKPKAWERVHCFAEKSGELLWSHSYEANYNPKYVFQPKSKSGPQSTPIIEAGRIYSLGIVGDVVCLDALTGTLVWKRNFVRDYGLGDFYTTPSLLIEGSLLILVIGGQPDACVVAVNKNTGEEVWRALGDQWTYSSPIVINAGGHRQLIVWTREAVTSLDPATGKTWWREMVATEYAVVTPVFDRNRLLVNGVMFQLDHDRPAASVLWPEKLTRSRIVLTETSLPLLQGDCVYSNRVNGHLVCLDARTGAELWRTDKVTDQGNAACMHLTPNGNSVLIFTDQGNLIRARLAPEGYEELTRVHLIDPTYFIYGRKVIWAAPAYANGHVFARNDEELLCASLLP